MQIGDRITSCSLRSVSASISILISISCGHDRTATLSSTKLIAYDGIWEFNYSVDFHKTSIPELITGERSSGRKRLTLVSPKGTETDILSNIYAMDKNGHYSKYNPNTNWAYSQVDVYAFSNRIYMEIIDLPTNVTNCNVGPPESFVKNSKDLPESDALAGRFWGEFNPQVGRFFINRYVPNVDFKKYQEFGGKLNDDVALFFLDQSKPMKVEHD